MLVVLVSTAFLLSVMYYFLRWKHWYKCVLAIPGPSLLAHLRILLSTKVDNIVGVWDHMANTVGAYDGICKSQIGPTLAIIVWKPAYVETVLTSHHTSMKHQLYNWFFCDLAKGVLTENGPTWKELRKCINKGLNRRLVDTEIQKVFIRETNDVLDSLKNGNSSSKKWDMLKVLTPIMMNSFSETQLGVPREQGVPCKDTCIDMLCKFVQTGVPLWLKYSYLWKTVIKITGDFPLFKRNLKKLHEYPEWIIQKRLSRIEAREEHEPACFTDCVIKRAAEYGYSSEQVHLEMTDFVLAGAETTLKSTTTALVLISEHPDVQEKIFQEQLTIFGGSQREPTSQDLAEMIYLGMVIKETHRLSCPINIFRQVSDDIKLGEYTIPKDCLIVISLALLHRLPKYWEHPDKFYPDHFLPEKEKARPKYAYCPFSMGKRSCPGLYYAECLMKTIISKVIRGYRLSTDLKYDDIVWEYSTMLSISNGCMVKCEERIADS